MCSPFKLLSFVLFTLFLQSCAGLNAIVDRYFPSETHFQSQLKSIKNNEVALAEIKPAAGIFISEKIILNSLKQLTSPEKIQADSVSKDIEINRLFPHFKLDKQVILVSGYFDIYIPSEKVNVIGNMSGQTTLIMTGNKIMLFPSLEKLENLSFDFDARSPLSDNLISALSNQLSSIILDNLNVVLFSGGTTLAEIVDPKLFSISRADIFDEQVKISTDDQVTSRYFGNAAFKIDKNGIAILVGLRDTPSDTQLTREQEIGIESPVTRNSVENAFTPFSNNFDNTWNSRLEPSKNDDIEIHISTQEIASVVNETLDGDINAFNEFTIPKETFSETVEYERKYINCQNMRDSYTSNSCQQDKCSRKSCSRRSCDYSCQRCVGSGWLRACANDPVCITARGVCNATAESEKAACNIREEAKLGACNIAAVKRKAECDTKYNLDKAAFDAKEEAEVVACNVAREALDFLALGDFRGEGSGNGGINLKISDVKMQPDLSTLSLTLNSEVDIHLNSHIKIQPKDIGYVFMCLANYSDDKDFDANVILPSQQLTLNLSSHNLKDGTLEIKGKYSPLRFNAMLTPAPLVELVSDNDFALRCPQFKTTIETVGGIYNFFNNFMGYNDPTLNAFLRGEYEGSESLGDTAFKIAPLEIDVSSNQYKLIPMMAGRSISFNVRE